MRHTKKNYSFGKNILFLVLLTGLLPFLQGCDENAQNAKEIKFSSRGGVLEVIVVTDSTKWNGSIGNALRDVFMSPLPGLPREELDFKLLQITPTDFTRFLKIHHNVILITVLNDNTATGRRMKAYFTKETLNKIRQNPDLFMIGKSDEFALGQKGLYLFGKNNAEVAENILKNRDNLKEYFYKAERARILKRLLSAGASEQKELSQLVYKETGLRMRIPSGYEVAKTDSNFVWLRRMGKPYDRSILITYGNYSSQDMFQDSSLVNWRNYFGYKYMKDPDTTRKDSYMSTQDDFVPIVSRNVNIDNHYAKEVRGLWKTKNNTRGGPFLGYAFVDDKKGRFYYIEGFIYAPNEKQRREMFEMESILYSFKL
ncbi:MAG: DUF4837 family protein [Microscillaceae bacterium]|nr:DUF4837 family protein [Microscillaceae bacterium]